MDELNWQARQQLEQELEQIGNELGMVDSQCVAWRDRTHAWYDAPDGSYHTFDLTPIGSDTVLPKELQQP